MSLGSLDADALVRKVADRYLSLDAKDFLRGVLSLDSTNDLKYTKKELETLLKNMGGSTQGMAVEVLYTKAVAAEDLGHNAFIGPFYEYAMTLHEFCVVMSQVARHVMAYNRSRRAEVKNLLDKYLVKLTMEPYVFFFQDGSVQTPIASGVSREDRLKAYLNDKGPNPNPNYKMVLNWFVRILQGQWRWHVEQIEKEMTGVAFAKGEWVIKENDAAAATQKRTEADNAFRGSNNGVLDSDSVFAASSGLARALILSHVAHDLDAYFQMVQMSYEAIRDVVTPAGPNALGAADIGRIGRGEWAITCPADAMPIYVDQNEKEVTQEVATVVGVASDGTQKRYIKPGYRSNGCQYMRPVYSNGNLPEVSAFFNPAGGREVSLWNAALVPMEMARSEAETAFAACCRNLESGLHPNAHCYRDRETDLYSSANGSDSDDSDF